ncbi:MAG: type 4a pilus biogenesis protein PilO [Sedimentisphaerales bacterium]|nr:type 4a pilus biogenesis protein PilO [Sedimentisphaerales bacterium]
MRILSAMTCPASSRKALKTVMKSSYKRYLSIVALIWAGFFVLLMIFYVLILGPQIKSKKKLERQFADKQRTYNIVIKAAQAETRAQLNRQIETLRSKLRNFVINPGESADLIFDISQIAKEKKLGSISIKEKKGYRTRDKKQDQYISENRIDVSFTSDFLGFATFLNMLERHRPVVFVDDFEINRSEQKDTGHEVNMNLSVFVREQRNI